MEMEPTPTETTEQATPLYTIEPISPRELQVRPNRNKWNLGHPTAAGVRDNPITVSDENTTFTAVATLKHPALPDQTYYLEDLNTPHGWKTTDCQPASKGDNIYIVLKGGEYTVSIARKLGIDEGELCEHNEITPGKVKELTELHLPYPIDTTPKDTIQYTIYDEVKTYHITRAGGARKYSFENLKSWRDIKKRQVGSTAPQYKNVRIKGEAMLEFKELDTHGNTVKCGFYLEETVIEPATGRVVKPIGYPFEFLEKGESPLEAAKHHKADEMRAFLASVEPFTQEPEAKDYSNVDAPEAPATDPQKPTSWRDSYVAYPEARYMRTVIAQDVFDLSGSKPVKLHFYGKVWIAGEFQRMDYDTKQIITYGRPWASAENVKKNPNWRPDWYGIDIDNLEPVVDDEDAYEPVDPHDMKLEVTPVDDRRRTVYADELFRPVMRHVAKTHVKVVDSIKKLQKKDKV